MRLIVTADDFGRSKEINDAVLLAHRQGILTSASLMVAGDAFEHAVELARSTPTLAVGLHLVVVDGRSVLPPGKLAGLVDERGFFPDAPARLGFRYYCDRNARARLSDEITAQFDRFAASGLPLAHVDGHQHMHVHPSVFDVALPLAIQHRAGGYRLPRDLLCAALRHDSSGWARKITWRMVFSPLSWRCRRRLAGASIAVADRVIGLMQTGQMNEAYLQSMLDRLRVETAEIYFHPTTGQRLNPFGPNPGDLAALLSNDARRIIDRRHIQLCAYPDLAKGMR